MLEMKLIALINDLHVALIETAKAGKGGNLLLMVGWMELSWLIGKLLIFNSEDRVLMQVLA